MNLNYEIINNGTGYVIKKDSVTWIKQDTYIPFPAATLEESAQLHIDNILAAQNAPAQMSIEEEVAQSKAENEANKQAIAELTMLLTMPV